MHQRTVQTDAMYCPLIGSSDLPELEGAPLSGAPAAVWLRKLGQPNVLVVLSVCLSVLLPQRIVLSVLRADGSADLTDVIEDTNLFRFFPSHS